MELYPGVYQIQSLFGGRNLFQYLFVGDNCIVVDTGISETPEKVIFPYMDRLGLAPTRLTLAVTTHADLDHQGGNDAIKSMSPGTWLSCGEADRELVEDPQTLFDQRYNFMRKDHEVGFDTESMPLCGQKRRMDMTFSGGEKIRVRDDWVLDVLHVPGHSHGHLTLYDPKFKAAFVGDAVHGRGSHHVGHERLSVKHQEKSRVTDLDGGIDESYNDRSNREGGGAQTVTFVFQKCLHIQNGNGESSDR